MIPPSFDAKYLSTYQSFQRMQGIHNFADNYLDLGIFDPYVHQNLQTGDPLKSKMLLFQSTGHSFNFQDYTSTSTTINEEAV